VGVRAVASGLAFVADANRTAISPAELIETSADEGA
jgi:hypothetical protein